MRLGLGSKLILIMLGLLGLLTAGALFIVRQEFGQQLRSQAERELRAGSFVLTSILERSGAQLIDRGKVLADLPSLHEAMTAQPAQLEPLLVEVKAIRAANLLWATDAMGKVLASTGEVPPLGTDLSGQPLIAAALSGNETLGFDLFGGQWWLVLTLPVKKSGAESLGTVSLALLVGESYLARLSELMSNARIGFIWGEHELWSHGWPKEVMAGIRAAAVASPTGEPQEIALKEGHLLWLSRPVTGGQPPIAAGPIALLGLPLDETVIQRTSRSIAWTALAATLIGAFISIVAVQSVTRPVKALVADTHRIGAGDLSHRSQIKAKDEIGDLAGSFNLMVQKLQTSYKELSELNRTLEERVHERTKQLEQAQAQLLQAEKLASIGELAAGVAHELNNPLMVIMGNAQLCIRMLAKNPNIPEEAAKQLKEFLVTVDQETHRSKQIVANLLDFSRVKPPMQVETDIHTLLDESLRLVDHQASLQSVTVVRKYIGNLPRILLDPSQIKQVLVNCILNGVQAMPKGGTLTLETAKNDGHVVLQIKDSGVGIPEEALSKVFDPFFTTKEVGKGTGLGLSVSYGIIQRHNGTIKVDSKIGSGTTITIQLPLR